VPIPNKAFEIAEKLTEQGNVDACFTLMMRLLLAVSQQEVSSILEEYEKVVGEKEGN